MGFDNTTREMAADLGIIPLGACFLGMGMPKAAGAHYVKRAPEQAYAF